MESNIGIGRDLKSISIKACDNAMCTKSWIFHLQFSLNDNCTIGIKAWALRIILLPTLEESYSLPPSHAQSMLSSVSFLYTINFWHKGFWYSLLLPHCAWAFWRCCGRGLAFWKTSTGDALSGIIYNHGVRVLF